ncbi:DNA-binding transcriptional regulator, LysR family [Amycolatopsis arida]|uniref:DNA-binding transcriptional regulator, LysR family n=1 Tax=Amycolatopsis arida TaxID=587909 RepID=A0A1I5SSB0_9PSEU|nr:LysR family transcriptional regulator [Amycolatopsis arida]TDX96371.1 DNA-binding transcriptional LysR family regulator [Amycolatopsis arida]SFP73558.1 DNA-binding transcriptional regulator, LysR family [Amycolatopsis arida]
MASLRQLEYLVTVVDEGSFTRAAQVLHVTQPALSHQLRALERAVGGPLLERLPRAVRLTPMGRAMLPHARAALADARRARCAARRTAGLEAGELTVATVYSVTLGVLPPALRDWRKSYPDVHIALSEFRHGDGLRAAMAAGEADVAVGPRPAGWKGLVRDLGVEEFVVLLPAGDPLAGTDRVDLRELADRHWVHYAEDHGLATVLDRAAAAAGFTPRAAVRTEQTAAAPVLASAGLGPALVPVNIVPPRFGGTLLRPDPPIRRDLVAYRRGSGDPLSTAFVETLARHASVLPSHLRGRFAGA